VYLYEGKAYPLSATQDKLPPGTGNKLQGLAAGNGVDPNQAFFGKMMALPSANGELESNCRTALNEYIRNQTGKFKQGLICAWVENEKGILPAKVGLGRREAIDPKIAGLSMLLVPVTIKADIPSSRTPLAPFKVSHAPSYSANSSDGQWITVSGSVQMVQDSNPPPQPNYQRPVPNQQSLRAVTYLKVALPADYRDLSDAGLQLRLLFKLGNPKLSQPSAPPLEGELRAEVRKQGNNQWSEIYDHAEAKIQRDKSIVIPLPWDDYLAVLNSALVVRVSFTQTGAPQTAKWPLVLQEVECKPGRR